MLHTKPDPTLCVLDTLFGNTRYHGRKSKGDSTQYVVLSWVHSDRADFGINRLLGHLAEVVALRHLVPGLLQGEANEVDPQLSGGSRAYCGQRTVGVLQFATHFAQQGLLPAPAAQRKHDAC